MYICVRLVLFGFSMTFSGTTTSLLVTFYYFNYSAALLLQYRVKLNVLVAIQNWIFTNVLKIIAKIHKNLPHLTVQYISIIFSHCH